MKTRLLSIFLLLCCTNAFATDLSKFTRHLQNEQAKISPDGKHIALRTLHEGKRILVFLNTKTRAVEFSLIMSGKESVGGYRWVNNERVVVDVLSTYGVLGQTYNTGRLFAIDYDGSKPKAIFGSKTSTSDGLLTKGKLIKSGFSTVRSTLENNDKEIIVSIWPWKRRHQEQRAADIVKINVYSGKQKKIMKSPGRGDSLILDHNDEVRFAFGDTGYNKSNSFYRDVDGEWAEFINPVAAEDRTYHGFNADNSKIYFTAFNHGDTGTLYSYNLNTKKAVKIYKNEFSEITSVLYNYKNVPYGVRIDEDYSNFLIFNKKVEHATVHQSLYKSFNGDSVKIINATSDGSLIIVSVDGDRNPGTYYLYDTKNNTAKFLFQRAEWLKTSDLAFVEPFKFKTRDNIQLNGYLTLPNGSETKNLPLVVMPHGGPRSRDYWAYDFRTQYLAANGYAVLQVNFRGSSGFGDKIMNMGNHKWGSEVQFDIIDATNWAIKSGLADKNRICISGGSFGAFSALQSSALEPDLFSCTIGSSGVYDLEMMHQKGDIPGGLYGTDYLNEAAGEDPATLKANSPVNFVHKLKAPVLLIHGSADERTPIEQAEALEEKLNKKGHPLKTLYINNEYHGFIV